MKSDFILAWVGAEREEAEVSSRPTGVVTLTARAAAVLAIAITLSGCATAEPPGAPGSATGRPIRVVAAENVWGSIAAQVGGARVQVTSLVDNPAADPHDYEPTPADARAVASADVVVVNGLGYDTWASRLVAADGSPGQVLVDVGDVVGAKDGDNPHRWYDPHDVDEVADALVRSYQRLAPEDAATFVAARTTFGTTATAGYQQVVEEIRSRYGGTPVGASESIVAMLTPTLGLDLVTPPGFLAAISEGTDPTPADKATIDRQIAGHEIAVYVYNSQNATPDVQQQITEARAAGIPVTTITETMVPTGTTWQHWQTAQLVRLRDALARGVGR
jgi:zinc/manganese transport system substrate-binding protein